MGDRERIETLVAQGARLIDEAYGVAESSDNPFSLALLGVALARANLIRLSEAQAAARRITSLAE